jgi:hypothetical protein
MEANERWTASFKRTFWHIFMYISSYV